MKKLTCVIYNLIATAAVMIMFSSVCYAETVTEDLEIKCSENPLADVAESRINIAGIPKVQLTITTVGLRENGKENIIPVLQVGRRTKTADGMRIHILATCSSGNKAEISVSDKSLACPIGDGLSVSVLSPEDPKYTAVFQLAITKDDEKERLMREAERLQQGIAEHDARIAELDREIGKKVSDAAQKLVDKWGVFFGGGSGSSLVH